MRALIKSFAAASLLASAFATPAAAQETGANLDPVYVFNRICYAQVHDLDAIQEMALKLVLKSIDGA